jgi:hypothetical protein
MTVIIRNGKPQRSDSLCNTCYWVLFEVSYCSDYNDKRVPSKADMEEIAWIIRTKDLNRQVGFANGAKPEEIEEDELEIVPSE